MGYWKREYTERKGGKPLFKPEPKQAPAKSEAPERPAYPTGAARRRPNSSRTIP